MNSSFYIFFCHGISTLHYNNVTNTMVKLLLLDKLKARFILNSQTSACLKNVKRTSKHISPTVASKQLLVTSLGGIKVLYLYSVGLVTVDSKQ